MGLKSKPGKTAAKKLTIPDANAAREVNSNEAGSALLEKLANVNTITYETKDVALSDIRLNPDNEIFREMDDDEDIDILAEDISRNGLLHNLVVIPQQEDGRTVYMLLSGERRYRAIKRLEAKGDATWNTIKNCNVITTKLSDNEKKVLLYSANLQVRGGFGDEAVRRTATFEFVSCLQKPPYNMTQAQAKKTIKEISPQSDKVINRDLRLEQELNPGLKGLLNEKFLTRSESEIYLQLAPEWQERLAGLLNRLHDVDCCSESGELAGKNYLEVLRDDIHDNLREGVATSLKAPTYKAADKILTEVTSAFEESIADLEKKAAKYKEAHKAKNAEVIREIEHEGRKEAAKKREEARTRTASASSVIQKCIPKTEATLNKVLASKRYAAGLNVQDREVCENDIKALESLIRTATELKAMIEDSIGKE